MKMDNFCLIIGTQKGGTSSLFSYLSQHPQIAVSTVKETNFFIEAAQRETGIEGYKQLWDWNKNEHRIALEASPNYTNSFQEAREVAEHTGKLAEAHQVAFKFVYVLRNPLEKVISMRKQGVYQGWYEPYLARETPDTLPPEVIETVRYADVIDIFVERFGRDRIFLIKTEDISPQNNPAKTMRQLCEFLEVDPTFAFELQKIHNAQNSYREDTLWHYLRNQQFFNPLKKVIPDTLKNKARSALSKPIKAKDDVVPPLLPGQKGFIINALKDERARLTKDYGLDVSTWANISS